MILFIITTFHWATCCVTFFIPIVRPYLANWLWQRITPISWLWNWAHDGCYWSTGVLAPPRQIIPSLVFPEVRVSLIFTMDYSIHLVWILILTTDFFPFKGLNTQIFIVDCSVYLILTIYFDYWFLPMKCGSWLVWQVNRGCFLLLCTWYHLRYVWGPC
jgi:hypothetical protein